MKKILMLLAFAGVAAASSAQQVTVTETEVIEVQDKYQVLTNPFWSNSIAVCKPKGSHMTKQLRM